LSIVANIFSLEISFNWNCPHSSDVKKHKHKWVYKICDAWLFKKAIVTLLLTSTIILPLFQEFILTSIV